MPARALRLTVRVRSDRPARIGPKTLNARQGIKTFPHTQIGFHLQLRPKTLNARQGIKTESVHGKSGWIKRYGPKTLNARQGIKT